MILYGYIINEYWQIDKFINKGKHIYQTKEIAEKAIEQMQKAYPVIDRNFEIIPVYIGE